VAGPGVLVITGGSRGIGAETARLAAAAGWDVAVNYREDREAHRLAAFRRGFVHLGGLPGRLGRGLPGSMSSGAHAAIEFWFDFSSGYAYFAAQEIDSLATRHGREVLWRPYMLGVAFKHTGARGLSGTPMKERVKAVSAEAIEKGVFGSPFFRVDGEPFWGWDRMPILEAWLEGGGW
jgi:NAD(P)-dependent dehydrogenase (short-subunit alcohol dehydrogenase family)